MNKFINYNASVLNIHKKKVINLMVVRFINRVFFSFALCFCYFATAQNLTPSQIDLLSVQAIVGRNKGNVQKYYEDQLNILKESQKIKYSKGIALSHFEAGIALQVLGNCNESVKHFSLSEKEKYVENDFGIQSEINRFLGECYNHLGLFDISIQKHKKAIQLADKANSVDVDILKAINYNDLGASVGGKKESSDSTYYYQSKAFFYISKPSGDSKKFSIKVKNSIAAVIAANIGEIFDEKGRPDSANYYFFKSLELNKNSNNKFAKMLIYIQIGNSYSKNKKYKQAIEYFEKAIKSPQEPNYLYLLRQSYKGMSEVYEKLGDGKKQMYYTQLYVKTNDSIVASEKKEINNSLNKIIKDERIINEESKSKLYWIIGGILLLATLVSLFYFLFYQKMKRKKDDAISDSEIKLAENREIIEQKEQETQQLKLKLNESFDEVVQLAKENSPEFLTRFQEVYPEYNQKLITLQPKLLATEVKLCAMIYLGFSTKDIAEYTFVTIKAVQHRKFRLRKKLNIPSDADINVWLSENY